MPTIELTNRVNSDDSEAEVRARVLRFLASRGYRATPDPNEFKRGSLFGSLTGFTPKKWAVTVRFETLEPGSFFYRFEINTTGQAVALGERAFWDKEAKGLEDTVVGHLSHALDAADQLIASQSKQFVKNVLLYSFGGGVLVGTAALALHFVGIELFPGVAGVGAGIGAYLGIRKSQLT